jgi:hypothetical protein
VNGSTLAVTQFAVSSERYGFICNLRIELGHAKTGNNKQH